MSSRRWTAPGWRRRWRANSTARAAARPVSWKSTPAPKRQKAGVPPQRADAFIEACRGEYGLPVAGLMCLPPQGADPGPHFDLLREIAARHGLSRLSMGMTADFETAIARGATLVRIGTAVFGPRGA